MFETLTTRIMALFNLLLYPFVWPIALMWYDRHMFWEDVKCAWRTFKTGKFI